MADLLAVEAREHPPKCPLCQGQGVVQYGPPPILRHAMPQIEMCEGCKGTGLAVEIGGEG